MFKVVKGSGMGLCHSPSVAEASLLIKAARELTTTNNMQAHGVKFYFRFKDDIILHCNSNKNGRHSFFRKLKEGARPFKVECTEVSRMCTEFLELQMGHKHGVVFANLETGLQHLRFQN